MIKINETDIIPLLEVAKMGYTEMILKEDPQTVEMAERIEQAITDAMDIIYDYQTMAEAHAQMIEKYEKESAVISRGMDIYQCPVCGKRVSRNHSHCHWCGKKLGWKSVRQNGGKSRCRR